MRSARLRLLIPIACLILVTNNASATGGGWSMAGHDLANTRSNPAERTIGPGNAARLGVKWAATTHGDVSATPAVVDGALYFPDWGGYFSKVDARTGSTIWSRRVSDYLDGRDTLSRNSPVVYGSTVYLGSQAGDLIAVDTRTGDLRWTATLDDHPAAALTASAIVTDGVVYQGVSSLEESLSMNPDYPCCTFRGSFVAVDANSGQVRWKTHTIPDNGGRRGGYSGGSVWSSTPVIARDRKTVYITTSNNYTVPASVTACQNAGGEPAECMSPDNRIDSIVALDTRTGRIKWSTGAGRFDAWTAACIPGKPPRNCPDNPGEDYAFSDGPHLFEINGRRVVGAGQKSGEYWTVDAVTGEIVWSAAPGPGSKIGGIMWGTATDGKRIYLAEANYDSRPYTLPNGQVITWGSYAALDAATGRVIWQVGDPERHHPIGAVTVANGVMYAGSMTGQMYAFDAATGTVLWSHQGQGSVASGPVVVNGTVYWGNGYFRDGFGKASTTLYAFSATR